MLQKAHAAYCSPGRQFEIESTVHKAAVGGEWGKDLGNPAFSTGKNKDVGKRWRAGVGSSILRLGEAGIEATRVNMGAKSI